MKNILLIVCLMSLVGCANNTGNYTDNNRVVSPATMTNPSAKASQTSGAMLAPIIQ